MSSFAEIAREIGVVGYNYPQFSLNDTVHIESRSDLIERVSKIFTQFVGGEIVLYYAFHKAAEKVFKEGFEGAKVPIILYGNNKELFTAINDGAQIINKQVFNQNISKKVTEKNVEEQLIEIKKQIEGV
jgi:hypothetical protein